MSYDASTIIAWLVLRAVYAWMYLYPAVGLLNDWPTTVKTTGLLFKTQTEFFAGCSLVVMVLGAVMILFGVYGQYAAVALLAFNLGGARIHYLLAAASDTTLSDSATADDHAAAQALSKLAVVGHVTSAQKNFVLAAVAAFFALAGTGPWSLTASRGIFSF